MFDIENITSLGKQPDFIFLTSCPEDVNTTSAKLTEFLENGAYVQCIVHEASKWDPRVDGESPYAEQINFMIPWVKKGQWEFVTLAPHVQKYVHDKFPTFMSTPDVQYEGRVLHPVLKMAETDPEVDTKKPFAAIPGKFEPWRRDYDRIFANYVKTMPEADLHLVGSGRPLDIPKTIESHVHYRRNLQFPQYFAHLSTAIGIIPAFASPAYTLHQASSSIATAVICGVPLIADEAIVKAYTQIPADAMWVQGQDESEIDTLARVSRMGPNVWKEKKKRILQLRDDMMEQNKAMFVKTLKDIELKKK
ncbi:uncharacterized protein V2V93DRAFT_363950 [Kockiozyma suomiensis]|uniref:uncharacterized protein n=1 Tax=Kockiozyma suomiensis TaxID=1337062 RepID=UPI0033438646